MTEQYLNRTNKIATIGQKIKQYGSSKSILKYEWAYMGSQVIFYCRVC